LEKEINKARQTNNIKALITCDSLHRIQHIITELSSILEKVDILPVEEVQIGVIRKYR